MRKILFGLLLSMFWLSGVSAAPLNDFEHNIFQIDLGFAPNVSRSTNSGGTIITDNTSDYGANLTIAFSDSFAVRGGITSITQTQVVWTNTNPGSFSAAQANVQILFCPSEYIQPFLGIQFATMNLQSSGSGGGIWTQTGVCGGLQAVVSVADFMKLNASGMLGSYMNSAYGGISFCLTDKLDLDAGYMYENYLADKITPVQPGSVTSLTLQGPRIGLSIRM